MNSELPEILYVVGGKSRSGAHRMEEWHSYSTALVLRINTVTGAVDKMVEYVSPAEFCADDQPSITFKAGTLRNGLLYCCTQTEILVYSVPDFAVQHYVTHPWFNDLHHVRPNGNGKILVTSTGLDMVMELSLDGNLERYWYMLDDDPWERFSKHVDYRKVATTKPHKSHPNFTFFANRELWATRFFQKDILCLTDKGRKMILASHGLHDGVEFGGAHYFTSVEGCLHIVDNKVTTHRAVDLNRAYSHNETLGWCRGVKPVSRDLALVGFSAIRGTTVTENLEWAKRKISRILRGKAVLQPVQTHSTRLTLFDLAELQAIWEINLGKHDLHAIYSIH